MTKEVLYYITTQHRKHLEHDFNTQHNLKMALHTTYPEQDSTQNIFWTQLHIYKAYLEQESTHSIPWTHFNSVLLLLWWRIRFNLKLKIMWFSSETQPKFSFLQLVKKNYVSNLTNQRIGISDWFKLKVTET